MKAEDTVTRKCICDMYDKVPFYSPWDVNNTELHHCYECDAYHEGKLEQSKLSFPAGEKQGYKKGYKGAVRNLQDPKVVAIADKALKEERQAGRKEVVEWVNASVKDSRIELITKFLPISEKEWQAQLKEWEL